MIQLLKPGSIVVDLASEAGGNCELTEPGKLIQTPNGVKIIGYTDFPSRLPTQASMLYSNNVVKFLLSMTPPNATSKDPRFYVDLEDEVVRGSILLNQGVKIPPPPKPQPPPTPTASPTAKTIETKKEQNQPKALTPFQKKSSEVALVTAASTALLALGSSTSPAFVTSLTTFTLSGIIGYRLIWGVVPALHSPLMSVTNAISGIVGVGGMFYMGGGLIPYTIPQALAAVAVFLANINIFGGFVISQRMLDMFKREGDPKDWNSLYVVPAAAFGVAFLGSGAAGAAGMVQAGCK
jgi:NAD(P) transhydrogenase